MRTRLDEALFALADAHPEWVQSLSQEQQHILLLRRQGVRLHQIAAEYGLSKAAIRSRLYGEGMGLKRAGGILGHFRWLHTRTGMVRASSGSSKRGETYERAD